MRRRSLLAALASAGTLTVGCLEDGSNNPSDRSTDTPSPTPTETPAPPKTELAVEFNALQPALVEINTDYYQLVAEDNRQYLILAVSVASGPAPSRSALAFRFDGSDHTPRMWDRTPAREPNEEGGEQYSGENGAGWIVFDLPATGDASDAALVWPGGEWRPGDQLKEQLATPLPTLSLEKWRVPETVPLNSATTFELTVRNEGDQAGWFVGGINAEGWYPHRPVGRISRQFPPGETVQWEVSGEAIDLPKEDWSERVGDGEVDIQYDLIWSNGNERKSVQIVEE